MKDCCVATCSQPFCGAGNLIKAFGVALNDDAGDNTGGDGFPDCIDPSMVPITIHVQNFVSSYETKTTWEDCHPSLSLYCDKKNVISIIMDKSMEGNSETVMVEDGAECTLEIQNTTSTAGGCTLVIQNTTTFLSRSIDVIWFFNYTIYHDKAMEVKIDEGFSFEEGTKQFIRIKDCFFDTISGHGYDFQGINYIDLTRKFNWIVKHDAGNQPCSRDFSIERYALSMMKMPMTSNVSDDSEFWINDKWHCMWPGVKCSEGFVVGLDLAKIEGIRENTRHCMRPDVECNENFVAGLDLTEIESISEYTTIFNEIGLLTNLQRLDFSYQGLAGSIPSEVGLLTQLPYLSLGESPFSVFFLHYENYTYLSCPSYFILWFSF